MADRKVYKVRLTPEEAGTILEAVSDLHDSNTDDLRHKWDWWLGGDDMAALKAENAALRRVRDALKRQLAKEV